MSIFYKLLIHTSDGHRFARTMRSKSDQDAVVREWRAYAKMKKQSDVFVVSHASGEWNFRLGDIIFMEVSQMADKEVLEETKLDITISANPDK